MFNKTVFANPRFGAGVTTFSALADLYSTLGYVGYMAPKDAYSNGFPSALRAAEIDDTLAEGHALLAVYLKQRGHN